MTPDSFQLFESRALEHVPAGFASCKTLPSGFHTGLSGIAEARLWEAHEAAMEVYRGPPLPPPGDAAPHGPSLLDLKLELARRLLGPCRLCWLRCPVDRTQGETGACGLGEKLRPYQDFVHLGEELELIPTHAVFLAGCNYRCSYCSDWDHVDRPTDDPEIESSSLSRSIEARRGEGALSLSFVGGLPDVNLPGILETLVDATVSVPVVWNSNMSATPEAQRLMEGVADAYVADLKYGNEACAQDGSAVKGSLAVTRRNLETVWGQAYLIVRHLVLPGHVECCALPTLDWLAATLPGVRVNLMDQYSPTPQVADTAWNRLPTVSELDRARRHAEGLGLKLVGPGQIATPSAGPSPAEAASPVVAFESAIRIGPDGEVVIENLSADLAALADELGDDPELKGRARAGKGWREPTD